MSDTKTFAEACTEAFVRRGTLAGCYVVCHTTDVEAVRKAAEPWRVLGLQIRGSDWIPSGVTYLIDPPSARELFQREFATSAPNGLSSVVPLGGAAHG